MAEPSSVDELYKPWPKQLEALWLLGCLPMAPPNNQPVNMMLWGGQAGPGKSTLIRMLAAHRALTWPGSHFAIFRKTNEDVVKNHVVPMRKEIPESLATFNWNRMEMTWKNGSVTEFHQCHQDNSHEEYVGFEWPAGIGIDESTLFREEAIGFLFSRIRGPGMPFKTMLLATNPGGRSHVWHKVVFVDGHRSGVPFLGQAQEVTMPDGSINNVQYTHCLLRAELKDNPSLDFADTMAGLLQIPDEMQRRAQAFGDWDLPAGQFFDTFNRQIHVVKPFEIPPKWPHWRGLDYADAGFTVCLWAVRNPETRQITIYREWVGRDVPLMRQPLVIKEMSMEDYAPVQLTLADPSMARKNGMGLTPMAVYNQRGVPLTKANNRREFGWARIKQALSYDLEKGRPPELQITDTCTQLIMQLANVERSTKPGDWADIKEPNNLTDPVRDDCLVGSTMVLTPKGEVRLDEIRIRDQVMTRGGWRPVKRAWLAGEKLPCVRVELSNGRALVGTPDHKIWTHTRGWVPLGDLARGDVLEGWDLDANGKAQLQYLVRVAAQRPAASAAAYDLTVDDDEYHEFMANGVIVSNCIDAARYLLCGVGAMARDRSERVRTWNVGEVKVEAKKRRWTA